MVLFKTVFHRDSFDNSFLKNTSINNQKGFLIPFQYPTYLGSSQSSYQSSQQGSRQDSRQKIQL